MKNWADCFNARRRMAIFSKVQDKYEDIELKYNKYTKMIYIRVKKIYKLKRLF